MVRLQLKGSFGRLKAGWSRKQRARVFQIHALQTQSHPIPWELETKTQHLHQMPTCRASDTFLELHFQWLTFYPNPHVKNKDKSNYSRL